ncbi:MAG: DUF2029 domain-containing protein, partial [Planctomycetota bacterium]|nr:DUF2029 domain-containing protein [Planctomycetota bacterium]
MKKEMLNFANSKRRLLLYFLFVVFVLVLSVRGVRGAGAFGAKQVRNDFAVYYTASSALLDGRNPYLVESPEGRRYLYPPLFVLLFAPAAVCGFDVAFLVYLAVQLLSLFVLLRVSFQLSEPSKRFFSIDENPLILFVTILFLWRAFDSDFANGQINTLVAASAILGVFLALLRRKHIAGGLLLALSVSFKLYTAPLALLFLRKESLRAVLWTVLGVGLFIIVIPSLFLGRETNLEYLGTFYNTLLVHYSGSKAPSVFEASGQSLWGVFQRIFTKTDASAHSSEPLFLNITDLPPSVVWYVYLTFSLAILVYLLVTQKGRGVPIAVALFCCAVVLVVPLARKAYFVLLTP